MMIKHFGFAGHFICADRCLFHLTTQVGKVLVSTVGAMKSRDESKKAFEKIGCDRKFETMVFETTGNVCTDPRCGCGLPEINPSKELDMLGYNTAGEAQAGHKRMVGKWSRRGK